MRRFALLILALMGLTLAQNYKYGSLKAYRLYIIVHDDTLAWIDSTGFHATAGLFYEGDGSHLTGIASGDSANVSANSHKLQGKDTTALWNAKTLQGKDTTALWNAKTLLGLDSTALFDRMGDSATAHEGSGVDQQARDTGSAAYALARADSVHNDRDSVRLDGKLATNGKAADATEADSALVSASAHSVSQPLAAGDTIWTYTAGGDSWWITVVGETLVSGGNAPRVWRDTLHGWIDSALYAKNGGGGGVDSTKNVHFLKNLTVDSTVTASSVVVPMVLNTKYVQTCGNDTIWLEDSSGTFLVYSNKTRKFEGPVEFTSGLAATTINSGTLDGDRLPAMSSGKLGGVPATGTPSGKYLRDDASWQDPGGAATDQLARDTAKAALRFAERDSQKALKAQDTANAAYALAHARSHSITSTSDHTSTATSGQMLKADANGLPVDATNTDAQVASAVTASHANTNDPTAGEKAALAGTSGTPGADNKYVTNADSRNSDARAPTAHAHGGDSLIPTVVDARHRGDGQYLSNVNAITISGKDTSSSGLRGMYGSASFDHSNASDPTADEKAALAGTDGTPSVTNKYVTNTDARNSNARTPAAHDHSSDSLNPLVVKADRFRGNLIGTADSAVHVADSLDDNTDVVVASRVRAAVIGNVTGDVTGNTSGSSGSCSGNSATATKLSTDGTETYVWTMTGAATQGWSASAGGVTAAEVSDTADVVRSEIRDTVTAMGLAGDSDFVRVTAESARVTNTLIAGSVVVPMVINTKYVQTCGNDTIWLEDSSGTFLIYSNKTRKFEGPVTFTSAITASGGVTGNLTGTADSTVHLPDSINDNAAVVKATRFRGHVMPTVSSTANPSSIAPDVDTYDAYAVTALAQTLTINAPTGTPIDCQRLTLRIYAAGSQTLSWNAAYVAMTGVTLSTSTTAGKDMYWQCYWNARSTKWDVVASQVTP